MGLAAFCMWPRQRGITRELRYDTTRRRRSRTRVRSKETKVVARTGAVTGPLADVGRPRAEFPQRVQSVGLPDLYRGCEPLRRASVLKFKHAVGAHAPAALRVQIRRSEFSCRSRDVRCSVRDIPNFAVRFTPMPSTPFDLAIEEVRAFGQQLRKTAGGYSVNFCHGTFATEYETDELANALRHAREVAAQAPPPPPPPLGPTGSRSTKRGEMYKHNRKLAARRRKQTFASSAR